MRVILPALASDPTQEKRRRLENANPPAQAARPSRQLSLVSNKWLYAGLGSLALFLIVTFLVVTKITESWDANLAASINGYNLGASMTSLMIYASEYGREYFWIPIVAILLAFGQRDTKILAIELAVVFAVGIIAGDLMKFLYFRERPFLALPGLIQPRGLPDTDSSFPSGHAIIVSIGAIFVLGKFRRKGIAVLLTLEAALVCYSRVYLGMHYPLDVLAGIFLGAFIVYCGVFFLERWTPFRKLVNAVASLAMKIVRIGWFSV